MPGRFRRKTIETMVYDNSELVTSPCAKHTANIAEAMKVIV